MVDSPDSNARERLESLAEFLDCRVGDLLPSEALGGLRLDAPEGNPDLQVEAGPDLEVGNGPTASSGAGAGAPSLSKRSSDQGGYSRPRPRQSLSICAGAPLQVTMKEGLDTACADSPGERLLEAPAASGCKAEVCAPRGGEVTDTREGVEETRSPLSPRATRGDSGEGTSAPPEEGPGSCASSPGSSDRWQRSFSDDVEEDQGARRDDDWEVI